ncbi:MAG: tetratricopeptide repeat protein [Candidatus Glassbacteria bacterium]|nr:tetratricopeptide repeat protein [Candidatus Glassbacteria bacterium]
MSVPAPGVKKTCFPSGPPAGRVFRAFLFALLFSGFAAPDAPARAGDELPQGYSEDFLRRQQAITEFEKGKRYFEDGSYDLARSQMLKVLELDREHLEARYYLGLVESRCGAHKLAVEHFMVIYRKKPRFKGLLYELASSHLALGHCDEARDWLDRHLKTDPKSKKAVEMGKKIKDCKKRLENSDG